MEKARIKEIALECGFKVKEQPDGTFDLNPYVYDFDCKIIEDANCQNIFSPSYDVGN